MQSIDSAISKFQAISLSEMNTVKLMNRTDRKYWFHRSALAEILEAVADDYYILEVNSERNLPYSTTYYDTKQSEMYHNHHRGKMNRYKIRRRGYISTKSSFLEVKFKSNKGRTIKTRCASDFDCRNFNQADREFLLHHSPYSGDELQESLKNSFRRVMLVSRAMNERCTIDSHLQFQSGTEQIEQDDLIIVEVKSDGRSHSPIVDVLRRKRLKPSGMSKYCLGRSLTDKTLKQNNFKRKHRAINKELNNPIKRPNI